MAIPLSLPKYGKVNAYIMLKQKSMKVHFETKQQKEEAILSDITG